MLIPDPVPNEDPVSNWTPPSLPPRAVISGVSVRLEPLSETAHGDDLFEAFAADRDGRNWTHRMQGPFATREELGVWLRHCEAHPDAIYYAYVDIETGKALGNGSFMSIVPAAGVIEVGSIMFSPAMQRTRMASEAMFLHMKTAFELGYRRYEWTCDPLNAASISAAERFGFNYEGIHRGAYVTKGRNRDKAFFAVTDKDWPQIRAAFEAWLAPDNFDAEGGQRASLRSLTGPHLRARGAAKASALTNELGQPVDPIVEDWTPPPHPSRQPMVGELCRVEPLEPDRHAADLFAANTSAENWAYLPYGPYDRVEDYADGLRAMFSGDDPMAFAILVNGKAVGIATYLRINPDAGSIEVGHINFSPALQGTTAATEAMHLMMKGAFELGYRRYEWKCNAANAPSRNAALRLGFTFESVALQALMSKGRNRDTAWFSIQGSEWPQVKAAQEAWLSPDNFDSDGKQKQSLRALLRASARE